MVELSIGDQLIRYDADETRKIYEGIPRGDADECGCLPCRNYAAQRGSALPDSFKALLTELGVDESKEGEVYAGGVIDQSRYSFGGWFYLRGILDRRGVRTTTVVEIDDFEFWFTSDCPDAAAFADGPLIAVEFTGSIPWILDEPPDF